MSLDVIQNTKGLKQKQNCTNSMGEQTIVTYGCKHTRPLVTVGWLSHLHI